jgi:hypothetical protein
MAVEFTVRLEKRPGTLGKMAKVLGDAGVNIEGMQAMVCGGEGIVQLVTSDPDGASKALDAAGIEYTSREVLLLKLANEPGTLARAARAMGEAGVDLDATYVTMGGQVVFGTADLAGARKVASGLGLL